MKQTKWTNLEEKRKVFEDISNLMKQTFPFYEADDKDDYIYLVKQQHILSATERILEYLSRA